MFGAVGLASISQVENRMKTILKTTTKTSACVVAAVVAVSAAQGADNYPTRPIRIVAPTSPGGANDVLARMLGIRMTQHWGQQVVVDVRPGAGGIVGSEIVARAAPDGYTLLVVANGYALNPFLIAKLPYDTMKDFERVTLFASAPLVLVVHPTVAAHTVPELIALARAKPNSLNYASSGLGSGGWLSMELLRSMSKIEMTHVPYKGAGQSNAAIVAGEVHMLVSALPVSMQFIKAGRLRGLGVTSAKRAAVMPQIPTIAEALPGYEVLNVFGMLAPGRTPPALVNTLAQEVKRITALPDVKGQLDAMGFNVENRGPAEFTAFIKAEMSKWQKVFAERGIKPE